MKIKVKNTIKLSFHSMDFWLGVSHFAYKTFHFLYVFGACLKVVWRFEPETFNIDFVYKTSNGRSKGTKSQQKVLKNSSTSPRISYIFDLTYMILWSYYDMSMSIDSNHKVARKETHSVEGQLIFLSLS